MKVQAYRPGSISKVVGKRAEAILNLKGKQQTLCKGKRSRPTSELTAAITSNLRYQSIELRNIPIHRDSGPTTCWPVVWPKAMGHYHVCFSPSRQAITSSSPRTASSTVMTGCTSNTKAGSIEQNL